MIILYCLDPLHDGRPDNDYVAEAAAAERQGAAWRLVDHDALIGGNAERAVRRVPPLATAEIGVYRGWMMTATTLLQPKRRSQRRTEVSSLRTYEPFFVQHYSPTIWPKIAHDPRSPDASRLSLLVAP